MIVFVWTCDDQSWTWLILYWIKWDGKSESEILSDTEKPKESESEKPKKVKL